MYITQGMLENAICQYSEKYHLNFENKKIHECIEECRKACPQLHTAEEIETYSENLIESIREKYGYNGLRIYYSISTSGIFANELLQMKYHKLLEDISEHIETYRTTHGFNLKLDVFQSYIHMKKYYYEKYGNFDYEEADNLYSLINTIRLSKYNPVIIQELQDEIKMQLIWIDAKFYLELDMTQKENIKALYNHLAEEMGKEEAYKGHQCFYDYNGYGDVIYDSYLREKYGMIDIMEENIWL